MNICDILFENADLKYRDFQSKLMPTVPKEKIIGVRTPVIRQLAKEIYGTSEAEEFIADIPHKYYEEDNLHGFIIEKIKNFDDALVAIDCFLPYIDNWATCDCISPSVFKKQPQKLLASAEQWLKSDHVYTVRYGIGVFMKYFLDEKFDPKYLLLISKIKRDKYYINMMIAWYFATALAKQYNSAIPYIENKILDDWIHRKTIQKTVESYRIPPEKKDFLRSLK